MEVERLDQALGTQVRHDMLEPANQSVQPALHALQIDLNGTRAALASRTLRAQHAGMVRDIRIWPGKRIEPGEVLMSVINDESDFYIEAFLPGDITPKLAPGMPLRLEMNGDRYANQTLIIDAVSTGIMGSTEARRYLGPQMADVVSITGPVVVVRARLTQRHFAADGHQYLYHDGMQATAAVQLSSQPLYRALVPGLERW
jgi:membrane fusion protein (multidrug efflux system)